MGLFLTYRRIKWLMAVIRRRKVRSPRLLTALRNLILILLWLSVFGMTLFAGFFSQAYHRFTFEEPVAEISVEPVSEQQASRITLTHFVQHDSQTVRVFLIRGDQWVVEGDILKWEGWLNLLGLHTRYRLTRIRGRFVKTEDEIRNTPTIYSLVENESHPLWRLLYEYGPSLPLVSTVYGNAVFQNVRQKKTFTVSVSTSGFVTREKKMP